MIKNPDPKKYRVKKLRKKGYVLVDRQIDRWRTYREGPKLISLQRAVSEHLSKEAKATFNIMDLFKDSDDG